MNACAARACVALAMLAPMLGAAGPAPDCKAIFPGARVTEHAAAPRYASCEGAAVGFGEHLSEQRALLEALRPAYERKLGAGDAAQAAQKLSDYDDGLRRLAEASAQTGKVAAAKAALAAASAASAAAGAAGAARQWLKDSKTLSQALGDRIANVADQLAEREQAPFCKQDFVQRVAAALQAKLVACIKPG